MLQPVIHRAALGRVAKIGALYDIRTESFLGDTLFGSKLGDEDVETLDLGNTSIELVLTDNVQEKFKKLEVEAELQVSLLAGMVKLSGSGAFLGEEKKSARAQSMSLLYKLRTVNEEIMIRHNKDKIDMDIMSPSNEQSVSATHVVVSIDWGAVCSVTCEYENEEDKDVTQIKGALNAELENMKALINDKNKENAYRNESKENHNKFTFICKADVSAPDKDLPVTFEGAMELARNLTSLVKRTNNGKGVPLTYMLKPLDAIVKMCRLQIQVQTHYNAIDDDIIKKCAQIVEGISKKKQTLYDIHIDLHVCGDYVDEECLVIIDDMLGEFDVQESGFKGRLQKLVKNVRSGDEDISSLDAFLSKELSDASFVSKYNDHIRGFQKEVTKLTSIKSWKNKGIFYEGRKDNTAVDDRRNTYVFYKTAHEDDKDNRDKNQEFFLRLQKTHAKDHGNYKFIVVDQEIRDDLWPAGKKKASVYAYLDGRLTSKDLYSKEGKDSEMCLIKIFKPEFQQILPSNRTRVKLRCPNSLFENGECTSSPITWMCSKCKRVVEYGIETKFFYCQCGKSDPTRSLFRCNEKVHGMDYVKYADDILISDLSLHRASEELNILILGETGVGKSTWINGVLNYLYYADMDEAMNDTEFYVLIPSSFTFIQDRVGEAKRETIEESVGNTNMEARKSAPKGLHEEFKEILIGESDANENMETGKSATKAPCSYVFYDGERKIRLIDTPGVGDSEGIQQDERNFDSILSYLTFYDEIHAVCILLKPNNSRLTAMFRFCIQELLTHLHSSAKDNIVFCFTNARATFYKPGDTLPALNKELRQREVGIQATPYNYFCFDNEAFRFLACLKNRVVFSQEEKDTYAASWNKSVGETNRLFKHISTLRPHKVRNTLSMNEARRIIVAMSKPLAEVAKTIQHNVNQGEEAKLEIDLYDKNMDGLKAKLKFSGFNLTRVALGHPITVCADANCIRCVPVGDSGVQNIVYEQVCHDDCYLEGIPTETTNDQRMQHCFGIKQGSSNGYDCGQCGHHYSTHMHITYKTAVFEEAFLSEDVQAQITQKKSAKETVEALKRAIDTKSAELKEEENIIIKTSAKYGSFLKANALIPYNDAVGDYLDMCIDQESKKAKEFRKEQLIDSLRNMKSQYKQERRILDNAIGTQTGENINTPEEIIEFQQKLFGLKHMGHTLKNFFDGISISRSARNIAFKEKIAPIRQNYKDT
ncbi:uncharacterized protein [Amphiura filiformis]|uniref:uncharacterized protein n=1 Tax=Amphiura filiformis TaxID=82378 RepID=UPI003B20C8BD